MLGFLLDPLGHRLILEAVVVWSAVLFLLLQLPLPEKADAQLRQAVAKMTSPAPGAKGDYTVQLGEGPAEMPTMAVLAHTALIITVRLLWL